MRLYFPMLLGALGFPLALAGCASTETSRTSLALPKAIHTRITFEPLDREQAQRYLQSEKQSYKVHTDPMVQRREALARGREERFLEVRREFPECDRQRHCLQHISQGEVKKFERYSDLMKEINRYDSEIIEIDTALRDWQSRLDLRTRAILNRFVVHEVLQLPTIEPHLQGLLVYSLESFETRRQVSLNLMRYGPDNLKPEILGDYDFRMLGRPVDEAAVIATFEVYLTTPRNDFEQPTRYVITMLINTHQLDLRFYDKDFLRAWATKFVEPYQTDLKQEAYCGMYSIAGNTLAPRIGGLQPRRCAEARTEMRNTDATRFLDRFTPDRWMLPLAYYPMSEGER
jgi:hypothetical protein